MAFRPPLFPLLISGTNRMFGRQFVAIRLLNILAISVTGALVFRWLLKHSGFSAAGVGATLFFLGDVRTRLYARAILTEGLPVSISAESSAAAEQRPCSAALLTAMFLLSLSLVYLPWAVRNSLVPGRFMPLGTQGLIELPAAFSEHAWQNRGVWFLQPGRRFYAEDEPPGLTRLQQELAWADDGRRQAVHWIRRNPVRAMMLGGMKVFQEYRPRSPALWLLAIGSVIGAAATYRTTATAVFLLLHANNVLMLAATWSVEGRFLVPLLFTIDVLAAIGICSCFRMIVSCRWFRRPAE